MGRKLRVCEGQMSVKVLELLLVFLFLSYGVFAHTPTANVQLHYSPTFLKVISAALVGLYMPRKQVLCYFSMTYC
jgi:hypothetical protein